MTSHSTSDNIPRYKYPLHWCVWHDDTEALSTELQKPDVELERVDVRGRTPLMLAVTLARVQCTRLLLQRNCSVLSENRDGWSVSQEAIGTGCRELVQVVLRERDVQRYSRRAHTLPLLLRRLTEAPDFYVEIKWEFRSWVPLVARMCPHDTYKVYKQGSRVRIDTTLLGFDEASWQRSNRSYVFKGMGDRVLMTEIDHERRVYRAEEFQLATDDVLSSALGSQSECVDARLAAPIVNTYVDMEKINFERNKCGIWGWRSDRSEEVNSCIAKVFSANNVELVTKTRTEHLDQQEQPSESACNPLHSVLGVAEEEERATTPLSLANLPETTEATPTRPTNPAHCSLYNAGGVESAEYFDESVPLNDRDIGRVQRCQVKVHRLKATLWLCEEFPLSLPDQVVPIVDLMSMHSVHFSKLKTFIEMQMPAGFPIKIEIPLFHVLTARITFCNIFGLESAVDHVTTLQENDRITCVLDDSVFSIPAGYSNAGEGEMRRYDSSDNENDPLQYAIQQSLLESGSESEQVDIWEALRMGSTGKTSPDSADDQLQRAILLSMLESGSRSTEQQQPDVTNDIAYQSGRDVVSVGESENDQVTKALELSRQEQQRLEQLARDEEEQLRLALQQSLSDQ